MSLQDFVNMDEDTRKEEVRKYNESAEVKRIFDTLMSSPFGQLFAGLY